mmetsp:Transcript_25057/g.65322  ORF Transcript_25057/g.65322 Transcript_25057/m.65322 type:complete len:232 (-) Transcript_25057:876-1571(-)
MRTVTMAGIAGRVVSQTSRLPTSWSIWRTWSNVTAPTRLSFGGRFAMRLAAITRAQPLLSAPWPRCGTPPGPSRKTTTAPTCQPTTSMSRDFRTGTQATSSHSTSRTRQSPWQPPSAAHACRSAVSTKTCVPTRRMAGVVDAKTQAPAPYSTTTISANAPPLRSSSRTPSTTFLAHSCGVALTTSAKPGAGRKTPSAVGRSLTSLASPRRRRTGSSRCGRPTFQRATPVDR